MTDYKKRIKVLAVDDEYDLCWAFETRFKKEIFDIVTVRNGEAAIEMLKKNKYPIIILDSKLPGIDGFEAAKIIKIIDPDTYIIIFTGYYDREDKEIQEGLKSGLFYDFLCKPFEFDDVKRMIKKVIKENISKNS
ncbi:MAG: response regulator [Candidatus Marinimicrobia bacterium]|nr:response regulator [Candidatus Neomarinimicrobiota bacterium]